MKIDPLERIEAMIQLHGLDALEEMISFEEHHGTEATARIHVAVIPHTAAALIERLRDTLPDDKAVETVLKHLILAVFYALGAVTDIPPGMLSMGAAMAAPPGAMEHADSLDDLQSDNEAASLAIAVKLSEEVTDSAEG